MTLKETFFELTAPYSKDEELKNRLWNEIELNYSEKNRFYHTLAHLSQIIFILNQVKDKIQDWESILWTIFYHDIIYKVGADKNEEKSAEFAKSHLSQLGVSETKIQKCISMILASKEHLPTNDTDTAYFLDADLSILGQSADVYLAYTKKIKQETGFMPNFLYKIGRKKILKKFLLRSSIYQTHFFKERFEEVAQKNIFEEMRNI